MDTTKMWKRKLTILERNGDLSKFLPEKREKIIENTKMHTREIYINGIPLIEVI